MGGVFFTMENSDQRSHVKCFRQWMNLQEKDLLELLQAKNLHNTDQTGLTPDLNELLQKNILHFQEYAAQRANLAQSDISPYFSPTWCSPLEGSMLWAGGCRPTMLIRLVYALCGAEIISNIDEYLNGSGNARGLGQLSLSQMNSVNELQMKTIMEEEKVSKKLAGLQEEMGDQPIAIIAKEMCVIGETSRELEEALNGHAASMMKVLEEADGLRLRTMKELMGILTPIQGVDYLAAGKRLHLCLHEWGRKKDLEHGRESSVLENGDV